MSTEHTTRSAWQIDEAEFPKIVWGQARIRTALGTLPGGTSLITRSTRVAAFALLAALAVSALAPAAFADSRQSNKSTWRNLAGAAVAGYGLLKHNSAASRPTMATTAGTTRRATGRMRAGTATEDADTAKTTATDAPGAREPTERTP